MAKLGKTYQEVGRSHPFRVQAPTLRVALRPPSTSKEEPSKPAARPGEVIEDPSLEVSFTTSSCHSNYGGCRTACLHLLALQFDYMLITPAALLYRLDRVCTRRGIARRRCHQALLPVGAEGAVVWMHHFQWSHRAWRARRLRLCLRSSKKPQGTPHGRRIRPWVGSQADAPLVAVPPLRFCSAAAW